MARALSDHFPNGRPKNCFFARQPDARTDVRAATAAPGALSKLTGEPSRSPYNHDALPEFAEPVPNVTAIVGRSVKLPCVVNNLGHYRVAWLRVESKTILTIHKSVITQNYRVHLSPSDRTWLLIIDSVQESDRGGYMCPGQHGAHAQPSRIP
ncbi:hypothetical protein MTO96_004245 [Rhipicephalus appendiculatus]